jgi:enhancing lycopene biosynthesis protein 2
MPMPSDAETIEAMGAERLEGKSDAVVAYVASRHAVITLRLAIAAERIADALEAIATRPGGMG